MIVLDTNVVSEMMRESPDVNVALWYILHRDTPLYLTSIVVAELFQGIERLNGGRRRTEMLAELRDMLATDFAGRILPFDAEDAEVFGRIRAERAYEGRTIARMDGLIAAVILRRGGTLATRNVYDFEPCGVPVVNPWEP
ncbi:MAG: type II toxin-antitoxin system VapC family toxin [Pseudomonadota bacterium]